ncbi:Crp/Fnr family transcriptional regulator [Chitinispirillales bacterium ANBcel5]|uniref:Crp/Fnr family transcriptional regulator n=1 Tax=Cellulosispirillum alkaliphilum TaxID=3039283 RepID=UPI002A51EF19|nr:Crp/Fnr family transcriptional regulator [Chitinispirillales bacterium ANBcel5]
MTAEEIESLASGVPLFSNLDTNEIRTVCSAMIVRKFEAQNSILFQEDDENLSFFIIASGSVHVIVNSSEGKQAILATLNKGDFFGEMAILDGEPRSASVVAAQDCVVMLLYRSVFLQLLEACPKISISMLKELSRRLRKSNRQINTLSLMSVYGRVAEAIIELGKEKGVRVGTTTVISNRPTHQQMADMVGASRETVSRILSQLQKKRYITIDRRKLVILHEEKLYY